MYKKKSLGQHFLHAPAYVRAIVAAGGIEAGERVLEIGPGEGALTGELLSRGAWVTAIEKDYRLIPVLRERFGDTITIIQGDALEIEPGEVISWPYKVIANIPYYITGALLRKFLSSSKQPGTLVFLVQKEVAERIAKTRKESILSLSVKAYGEPVYVKTVPRGAFVPPPDVDSAILLVKNISRKNFVDKKHEEQFFSLLHAGFAQKRKLLKRNIESILGVETVENMSRAGIAENARAEDVGLVQWLKLAAL